MALFKKLFRTARGMSPARMAPRPAPVVSRPPTNFLTGGLPKQTLPINQPPSAIGAPVPPPPSSIGKPLPPMSIGGPGGGIAIGKPVDPPINVGQPIQPPIGKPTPIPVVGGPVNPPIPPIFIPPTDTGQLPIAQPPVLIGGTSKELINPNPIQIAPGTGSPSGGFGFPTRDRQEPPGGLPNLPPPPLKDNRLPRVSPFNPITDTLASELPDEMFASDRPQPPMSIGGPGGGTASALPVGPSIPFTPPIDTNELPTASPLPVPQIGAPNPNVPIPAQLPDPTVARPTPSDEVAFVDTTGSPKFSDEPTSPLGGDLPIVTPTQPLPIFGPGDLDLSVKENRPDPRDFAKQLPGGGTIYDQLPSLGEPIPQGPGVAPPPGFLSNIPSGGIQGAINQGVDFSGIADTVGGGGFDRLNPPDETFVPPDSNYIDMDSFLAGTNPDFAELAQPAPGTDPVPDPTPPATDPAATTTGTGGTDLATTTAAPPAPTPDPVVEPTPTPTSDTVATTTGDPATPSPTETIPTPPGSVDPIIMGQTADEVVTDPLIRALYFGTADQPGFFNQLQQVGANLLGAQAPGTEYDPSMTEKFFNPFEDRVVQQTIEDVLKAGEQRDIAQRAQDIGRGGLSAFGSRARLTADERQEALGRGLGQALAGIRQSGFSEAQRTGLSEFDRQYGRDISQLYRPLDVLRGIGGLLPGYTQATSRIGTTYGMPGDPTALGLGAALNTYASLAPQTGSVFDAYMNTQKGQS